MKFEEMYYTIAIGLKEERCGYFDRTLRTIF